MVDARDLKSLDTKYRAGSIPAPGTIPVKKAVASKVCAKKNCKRK